MKRSLVVSKEGGGNAPRPGSWMAAWNSGSPGTGCGNIGGMLRRLWWTPPAHWASVAISKARKRPRERAWFERYVWCLSTGRVGTQTLAALGKLSSRVESRHEPRPLLYGLSRLAYDLGQDSSCYRILTEAMRACRSSTPERAADVYLETSPQVTFLAIALREVFPESSFIHIVRHPAAVVRSGMRRRWFDGNANDRWRIRPKGDRAGEEWDQYPVFEKNVWLWTETNRWIDAFLGTLPEGKGLRLRSEDIFDGQEEAIEAFFGMLGDSRPRKQRIEKVLGKQLNRQQTGSFPEMAAWGGEERATLEKHAGPLMERYGYSIPGM